MSRYDDRFDDTTPDNSVFADTGTLDPFIESPEIVVKDVQKRELATLPNDFRKSTR